MDCIKCLIEIEIRFMSRCVNVWESIVSNFARCHHGAFRPKNEMIPKQRILVIRHAESVWNVLRQQYPNPEDRYHPRMWTIDCDITEKGVQQAHAAGKELAKDIGSVDLLVISPLRRALQTASLLLEAFSTQPAQVLISSDATELMTDPCDIGSNPKNLAKEFPAWDFSHLDENWWHGGKSQDETLTLMRDHKGLESDEEAEMRINRFKNWLRKISAEAGQNIVIVCHGDFIWWLTRDLQNDTKQGLRLGNCEIVDVTSYIHC